MEKLNKDQLDKLFATLQKHQIDVTWIRSICNVSTISDISVRQYNFLLLLIEKIFL